MKKIYYLGSCDKCRKILRILEQESIKLDKQDIKTHSISEEQLDQMKSISGSYESLFSKSARKFKTIENKEKLNEDDFKKMILSEYTFLKRPVIISGDSIFIGVNPNNMDEVKEYLRK